MELRDIYDDLSDIIESMEHSRHYLSSSLKNESDGFHIISQMENILGRCGLSDKIKKINKNDLGIIFENIMSVHLSITELLEKFKKTISTDGENFCNKEELLKKAIEVRNEIDNLHSAHEMFFKNI